MQVRLPAKLAPSKSTGNGLHEAPLAQFVHVQENRGLCSGIYQKQRPIITFQAVTEAHRGGLDVQLSSLIEPR